MSNSQTMFRVTSSVWRIFLFVSWDGLDLIIKSSVQKSLNKKQKVSSNLIFKIPNFPECVCLFACLFSFPVRSCFDLERPIVANLREQLQIPVLIYVPYLASSQCFYTLMLGA